jgi:glycosyltransferase involved in cell wall biosynthesis
MKKIAFFSTGIPDPTQGGSGILNYYILKRLIEKKYSVDAYFKVNSNFFEKHLNKIFFYKLKKKLNKTEVIFTNNKDKNYNNYLKFGYKLLEDIHLFDQCSKVVSTLNKKDYYAYISLDLGWAFALKYKLNCLSILGDPYHSLIYYGKKENYFSFRTIIQFLRAYTTFTYNVLSKVHGVSFSTNQTIGSFAKQHVEEYKKKGIRCEELDWFSPIVHNHEIKKKFASKNYFNLLNIGDAATSASKKNMNTLFQILENISNKINFTLKVTFLGRFDKKITSPYKNIVFDYLGYVKNLSSLINCFDASIYAANYPVGIRTRIITSLSYGLPCIAHESSALALHRLKHKHDILFCKKIKDFEKYIILLQNDKKLQMKLSRNSRASWLKYYNPKHNVDKILKIVNC